MHEHEQKEPAEESHGRLALHHAIVNQKIIPMSPTHWLVNGMGIPARTYQSFPRWVRMPGVNTTLVWLRLARGVFTTVERSHVESPYSGTGRG